MAAGERGPRARGRQLNLSISKSVHFRILHLGCMGGTCCVSSFSFIKLEAHRVLTWFVSLSVILPTVVWEHLLAMTMRPILTKRPQPQLPRYLVLRLPRLVPPRRVTHILIERSGFFFFGNLSPFADMSPSPDSLQVAVFRRYRRNSGKLCLRGPLGRVSADKDLLKIVFNEAIISSKLET